MEQLQNLQDLLHLQFTLEYLIEHYESADKESERYYIKMEFVEFLSTLDFPLSKVKNYMMLQYDKFQPFIQLMDKLKDKKLMQLKKNRNSCKILMLNNEVV